MSDPALVRELIDNVLTAIERYDICNNLIGGVKDAMLSLQRAYSDEASS